jgi:hypothetical protein
MFNANALACVALIVRDPFDHYRRGDCIRDAESVKAILASEQARHVNKILMPEAPEVPAAEPLKVTVKTPKKSKE